MWPKWQLFWKQNQKDEPLLRLCFTEWEQHISSPNTVTTCTIILASSRNAFRSDPKGGHLKLCRPQLTSASNQSIFSQSSCASMRSHIPTWNFRRHTQAFTVRLCLCHFEHCLLFGANQHHRRHLYFFSENSEAIIQGADYFFPSCRPTDNAN